MVHNDAYGRDVTEGILCYNGDSILLVARAIKHLLCNQNKIQ